MQTESKENVARRLSETPRPPVSLHDTEPLQRRCFSTPTDVTGHARCRIDSCQSSLPLKVRAAVGCRTALVTAVEARNCFPAHHFHETEDLLVSRSQKIYTSIVHQVGYFIKVIQRLITDCLLSFFFLE